MINISCDQVDSCDHDPEDCRYCMVNDPNAKDFKLSEKEWKEYYAQEKGESI